MQQTSLRRMAASATLHCLTGCTIGEVLGLVIGEARGWDNVQTIPLSIVLAFIFGYSLSLLPLVRAGVAFTAALGLVLAADSLSISVMEIVDNSVMAIVPGAMEAGLNNLLFWTTLPIALALAFAAAFPVNLHMLKRGKGHALVHKYHNAEEHKAHEHHEHEHHHH